MLIAVVAEQRCLRKMHFFNHNQVFVEGRPGEDTLTNIALLSTGEKSSKTAQTGGRFGTTPVSILLIFICRNLPVCGTLLCVTRPYPRHPFVCLFVRCCPVRSSSWTTTFRRGTERYWAFPVGRGRQRLYLGRLVLRRTGISPLFFRKLCCGSQRVVADWLPLCCAVCTLWGRGGGGGLQL